MHVLIRGKEAISETKQCIFMNAEIPLKKCPKAAM